jgi:hypothetical protein
MICSRERKASALLQYFTNLEQDEKGVHVTISLPSEWAVSVAGGATERRGRFIAEKLWICVRSPRERSTHPHYMTRGAFGFAAPIAAKRGA